MNRAGIIITGDRIAAFCRKGSRAKVVDSPLPSSARFVSAHYDAFRDAFLVIFEDDSFEPVPEGSPIPILTQPVQVESESVMSKICPTCSCESVPDGVRIHDYRKWLASPIPCPECHAKALERSAEFGREAARRVEERALAVIMGSTDG